MRALTGKFVWLGLLAMLAAAPVPAADSVAPGINHAYQDVDYEQWRRTFEQPGREVYARRAEIVAASQVQPGMVVADVGAGSGLFTLLFAREVGPQGRVYAVDIAPEFVAGITARAQEAGLANVTGLLGGQRSTNLPPASIDLAFVCDTYHHFEYPQAMLRSLHQALRPGGRLIVIDYRRQAGLSSSWVMGHVRAGEEEVIEEISAAGFELSERPALLRANYFLIFTKR